MATTRATLKNIGQNVNESIGVRNNRASSLSPIPLAKDVGRKPIRRFGRVDIELVEPDSNQPRTEFSTDSIQRLASSIEKKGQFHPIRVRWSDERGKWQIISGERRWRATVAAGLPTIDCYFQDEELQASEILEQQLIENLLRENLKPMEQATAFSKLMEVNDWNGKQVAEALHVSPSTVSRALALLDLPEDIRNQVNEGELAASAAYEISKLPSASVQRNVAAAERPTATKIAAAVRQRRGKKKPSARGFKQTFFADNSVKVLVSASQKINYHEVEMALNQALAEVQHYLRNGKTS